MNSEYIQLSYERGVLQALIRLSKDHFLKGDGDQPPRARVICEELPQTRGEVPQEEVLRVIHKLERMAQARELELSRFTMVKADYNEEEAAAQTSSTSEKAQQNRRQGAQKGRRGRGRNGAGPKPAVHKDG